MRAKLAAFCVSILASAGVCAAQSATPSPTGQPEYSKVYCTGFVSDPKVPEDIRVISGEQSNYKIIFSRGDYVYVNRGAQQGVKLGGDAPPASLMHAKFSPDGSRVAYVRSNNIYVEYLREHRIKRLTGSTSADLINGTFDWVYEEEFSLRDGFRWSPDGNSIAYWQLDTTGVREFPLVNNIDSLYPRINPIKYPKVGETNAACRVGVVSAAGGVVGRAVSEAVFAASKIAVADVFCASVKLK